MAESSSTAIPEAAKATSTVQPPVQDINVAAEMEGDRTSTPGDRMVRAVGGGSPQTPPSQFAGALGQLGGSSQVGMLRELQRSYGNSYVGRVIQAKLTVGQPGDLYEQEADRVADAVMRMSEPTVSGVLTHSSAIQPMQIQRMCTECTREEEEKIHPKESAGQTPTVTPILESQLIATKGKGQTLPNQMRSFMEPRFSHNFSQVRVHTDSYAVQMNQELNAQAFTQGRDIYFGAGNYNPESNEGKWLIAHELTHVVQQTGEMNSRTGAIDTFIQRNGSSVGMTSADAPESVVAPADLSSTHLSLNHVQPLSEEQLDTLRRAIPGAIILSYITDRNSAMHEKEDREEELRRLIPEHGVLPLGSPEQQRIQTLEQEIEDLNFDIERLNGFIETGLRELDIDHEEQLVTLVTEEFPLRFIERAKQIAIRLLEQNKEIAEQEARRYGLVFSPDPEARHGLQTAAQDLISQDRQIQQMTEQIHSIRLDIDMPSGGVPEPSTMTSSYWDYLRLSRERDLLAREREQRRQTYTLLYPILLRNPNLEAIASGDDRRFNEAINTPIQEILNNIETTQENIDTDTLRIWDLRNIVEMTIQDFGIQGNEILMAAINQHIQGEQTSEEVLNIALLALSITTGLILTIVTGGAALGVIAPATAGIVAGTAIAVDIATGLYYLSESAQNFSAESAAGDVALDPESEYADISVNEPDLRWVLLDLVSLALSPLEVMTVFTALRQAARALRIARNLEAFASVARSVARPYPGVAQRLIQSAVLQLTMDTALIIGSQELFEFFDDEVEELEVSIEGREIILPEEIEETQIQPLLIQRNGHGSSATTTPTPPPPIPTDREFEDIVQRWLRRGSYGLPEMDHVFRSQTGVRGIDLIGIKVIRNRMGDRIGIQFYRIEVKGGGQSFSTYLGSTGRRRPMGARTQFGDFWTQEALEELFFNNTRLTNRLIESAGYGHLPFERAISLLQRRISQAPGLIIVHRRAKISRLVRQVGGINRHLGRSGVRILRGG
jgi:Domain of unknown function (DUF4157)